MHNEQIFTPKHVVDTMFNDLEYYGSNIRRKHIIDNSCGDGAILTMVVSRYINICIMCSLPKEETISELETYIHGIEIDETLYLNCLNNLNSIAEKYSLFNIKWDIVRGDAMEVYQYDGKMDYVLGNPPYCNVHHLGDRYDKVKEYKFADGGMTDLYLVFFEIGIKMLNKDGKLAYITPNSWLTSTAGTNFRNYLRDSKTLLKIYQYGHRKIFDKATTFTCITFLCKTPKTNNSFICERIIDDDSNKTIQTVENLDDCMINNHIYLTDKDTLTVLNSINEIDEKTRKNKDRIKVKNGFATLNDRFFIIDDYDDKNDKNIIFVNKASNGETHYFFYPYDKEGKPLKLQDINQDLVDFMRCKAIKSEVDTTNPQWYLYGRTQALNDVKYKKIIVNNLIRNENDIKIGISFEQQGIYSGFYIPLNEQNKEREEEIINCIYTKKFVNYIKTIGKYKNGGYYTFSSKDLEKWLNFCKSEKFLKE